MTKIILSIVVLCVSTSSIIFTSSDPSSDGDNKQQIITSFEEFKQKMHEGFRRGLSQEKYDAFVKSSFDKIQELEIMKYCLQNSNEQKNQDCLKALLNYNNMYFMHCYIQNFAEKGGVERVEKDLAGCIVNTGIGWEKDTIDEELKKTKQLFLENYKAVYPAFSSMNKCSIWALGHPLEIAVLYLLLTSVLVIILEPETIYNYF